MAKEQLPERLSLTEEGQWETPSWARTSDDDEWISYGWKAVTFEGQIHFRHKDKAVVEKWLADKGYVDTGDGAHYQRSISQGTIQRLEKHQAAIDMACWDCSTPLVPIGTGQEVQDGGAYREIWYWFQCPYCGLYVQTDLIGIGLTSTLDRAEVNIDQQSRPYPIHPIEGYSATWPTMRMCYACRGDYPAQAVRTWHKQGRKFVAETTYTRTPGLAKTTIGSGQAFPPCQCDRLEETTAPLEQILEQLPADYSLLIEHNHPDNRLNAASYLVGELQGLTAQWPRQHSASEVLEVLRATGPDKNHPLQRMMLYAFSPSSQRGTIRPIWKIGPDGWIWAEIITPTTPARQKASEYKRQQREQRKGGRNL
jgi:hypothetical protein